MKTTNKISYAEAAREVLGSQKQYSNNMSQRQYSNMSQTQSRSMSQTQFRNMSQTQNNTSLPISDTHMVTHTLQKKDAAVQIDRDDLVSVGPALAKLMLGVISICRNTKFKSKIELESGMKDLFRQSFGREMSGELCKEPKNVSAETDNESKCSSESQVSEKVGKHSKDKGGKQSSKVVSKNGGDDIVMGPPKSTPGRRHSKGGGKNKVGK